MLLFVAALAVTAVSVVHAVPYKHAATPVSKVRRAAEVEVTAAREIEIETIATTPLRVAPPKEPVLVARTPSRTPSAAPAPDFRTAVALQLESMPICRRGGGPEGPGLAEVTFMPDGTSRISLSRNYASTGVGACVARRFAGAARAFDGEPVTLKVRFEV